MTLLYFVDFYDLKYHIDTYNYVVDIDGNTHTHTHTHTHINLYNLWNPF